MSFGLNAKNEICQARTDRKCCAVAECYGVLLFCNTFSPAQIRITTANDAFAERLPKLFRKAFGVAFDVLPKEGAQGKRSFLMTDREKIAGIYDAFSLNAEKMLAHHINFAVIEEDCCRTAFVRGAFLAGGTVTDPMKRFHLELATGHGSVSGELVSVLHEFGFNPKESKRGGDSLVYFKQADAIADFLTAAGAAVSALEVMTSKVEKEMRNTVTRQINCDSANADKTVIAAQEQLSAIKAYVSENGLEALPEPLRDAALLRITNPEASLSDLARLSSPPVSKSCLSHRLRKIMALSRGETE